VRYVEQGGSVLLIGEHTNVFGSGTYLNQFAEKFGFRFRYDCLFGVDSVFDQHYVRPLVPHPSVQYVPWMEFATSDSIDPQQSTGRAAIQSTGLKNKTADYHVDNFYPPPNDTAAMRYGAFVQLWSMRYGRGKVLAFTDSTDFSNFCTFEPGKAEILLGMIEWLNHRTGGPDPRPWLMLAALALAAAGCWLGRRWQGAWLVLAAAAVLGWSAAVPAVRTAHAWALPEPKPVRPMVQVVMDQTLSDVILPKNGFISGKEEGFGIFERWILRLGYFTSRREGADAFRGNLLVIVYPSKPLPEGFREQLVDYVTAGGKVLVLDSPENRKSTADDLLSPFGLSVDRAKAYRGELRSEAGWPAVPIATAYPVRGGRSFAWLGKHPVAATAPCGKGSVTVLGFGSRFCDYSMGVTGDVVPDENLKQVYAVEFSLLRRIVEGKK